MTRQYSRMVNLTLQPMYAAIGDAIVAWAFLEQRVFVLFHILSGIGGQLSADVFFSANSFKARLDMVRAAIKHSSASPEMKLFSEAAINKASTYSDFRNAVAHGVPRVPTANPHDVVLVPLGDEDSPEKFMAGITVSQLQIAAANFERLRDHMISAEIITRGQHLPQTPPLPELTAQVELLPNQPWSSEPSLKQQSHQRQREAVVRKSAHPRNGGKAP